MKKLFLLSLAATAALTAGCSPKEAPLTEPSATETESGAELETLTGKGDGFGGEIAVTLTRENGKITKVEIVGDKETNGIGTPAIEQLPEKIVAANSAEVDVIAGATITSKGIIAAVNNALDPETYPYPAGEPEQVQPEAVSASDIYQGFGLDSSGRIGPGVDNEEVPVYSVNQVVANVLFDGEGKILAMEVDQLEYATPNYDGETMPRFSGFPGQGGYNIDEDHDGTVDGKSADSEENFLAEIAGWNTKRDRGSDYKMSTGTWASQMDEYQKMFVGMTVDEVKDWYAKYCSDINGRPLKADSSNEEDVTKFTGLSEEEQQMLADVVSGATMSLNDSHGNLIAAIEAAYENRIPVEVAVIKGMGIGIANAGRVGPGKDAEEIPVYSFNQVFANTLFDEEDRIAAIYIDQLEVSTPNYDGEGMPHFSGFPGQSAYNYDENHDGTLTERVPVEETFIADIESWETKRQRGDGYRMGTGTWASQMDVYQKLFVGMTAEEAKEWYAKYCSDVNGRPLKADSSNEEDVVKFNELSEEDQTMLADIVSGATMSLNDSHGDIISAIINSLDKKAVVDITVAE